MIFRSNASRCCLRCRSSTSRIDSSGAVSSSTDGEIIELSMARPCGHAVSATTGPHSVPAAELLADGRVQERLLRYLQRSHQAATEEAEDAAQEAAMRALQRGIRSCCAATFSGWLRRTAQNALFDSRKKQRSTSLPVEPEQLNAVVGPSAESRPGDLLEVRDDVEALLAHHDLGAMTASKKVQLGSAIGEHLTRGQRSRSRRVTKPMQLLEDFAPALAELATVGATDGEVPIRAPRG